MGETLGNLGSVMATLMLIWAMFRQYFPCDHIEKYSHKLMKFFYPHIQITFDEYGRGHFMRHEFYTAIDTYLSSNTADQANRLKANTAKNNQSLVLTIDDGEEVEDEFEGVKLWWTSRTITAETRTSHSYEQPDEKRYYRLTFHKKHRDLITKKYLSQVLTQGEAIKADKKREVIEDLVSFSQAKDFYARIGKAWKRGYLLYGPPGTGKSTMIAAMANLLLYDVYDLELTAVRDNTELRKLLMQIPSKSITVIEDIDCSLNLTGQRKKMKENKAAEEEEKDPIKKQAKVGDSDEGKTSKVTLSGLLNFIDGLWSASKGERLIVFTTNYMEKLDPALIRRGRMDKHIELSYCSFESFKVLAKNYLELDSHHLFDTIERLLGESKVTPADVAEHLMAKTSVADVETSLKSLVQALEMAKEQAMLKAKEEGKEKESSAREED
ncbi:AAA-ATPase ASD, mitochondrial [Vitis vinifera]|uniref:AAA-ATPase ASD, mitochondrial n=1 Tax=Vitis vinifera TaxID=29760 RepID=A0A438CY99_VITVI|nr:AAA-ATPase ASD, mitochondrial [Vitis vinifera]